MFFSRSQSPSADTPPTLSHSPPLCAALFHNLKLSNIWLHRSKYVIHFCTVFPMLCKTITVINFNSISDTQYHVVLSCTNKNMSPMTFFVQNSLFLIPHKVQQYPPIDVSEHVVDPVNPVCPV